MKKLLLALTVLMVFMLVGCDSTIEQPTIIIEREIVTIEIPVIVKEIEVIYVPEFKDTITKSVFFTADTNLAIITVGKGDTTYIIELAYKDTLLDPPMLYVIQIEKQVNAVTEDYFFFDDYAGDEAFAWEVDDYDMFVYDAQSLLDDTDEHIWEQFVFTYDSLYDDYYTEDIA